MSSPQMLHHLRRTSIPLPPSSTSDTSPPPRSTCEIHGTYTDYEAARAAAHALLHPPSPHTPHSSSSATTRAFETKDGHLDVGQLHGINGVPLTRIRSRGGTGYEVVVETGWNTPGLRGDEQGRVLQELWYVIQRTVRHPRWRPLREPSDQTQKQQHPTKDKEHPQEQPQEQVHEETEIVGTHLSRAGAEQAARDVLRGEEREGRFQVYEENHGQPGWKYGDEVLVRAVTVAPDGVGGEEVTVSLWHKPEEVQEG